jgi:hypothetical protein
MGCNHLTQSLDRIPSTAHGRPFFAASSVTATMSFRSCGFLPNNAAINCVDFDRVPRGLPVGFPMKTAAIYARVSSDKQREVGCEKSRIL